MVMGQWGTHFDRTQTWWNPGKAWIDYLTRCQGLLQWGMPIVVSDASKDFSDETLHSVHRSDGESHVFFVANSTTNEVVAVCRFGVNHLKPELWNPVDGSRTELPAYKTEGSSTLIKLKFAPSESCFIVFRNHRDEVAGVKSTSSNFDTGNFWKSEQAKELVGPWRVTFDSKWGGPKEPVMFEKLTDWTQNVLPGIKYYSGTAIYSTTFDKPTIASGKEIRLDLGKVCHLARVILNGHDLGVLWTAPWDIRLPSEFLKEKENQLSIEITNVWANRLIGDEQQPADCDWTAAPMWGGQVLTRIPDWVLKGKERPVEGRYCFTTWNYFSKDSQLISSGLLGPVTLLIGNEFQKTSFSR